MLEDNETEKKKIKKEFEIKDIFRNPAFWPPFFTALIAIIGLIWFYSANYFSLKLDIIEIKKTKLEKEYENKKENLVKEYEKKRNILDKEYKELEKETNKRIKNLNDQIDNLSIKKFRLETENEKFKNNQFLYNWTGTNDTYHILVKILGMPLDVRNLKGEERFVLYWIVDKGGIIQLTDIKNIQNDLDVTFKSLNRMSAKAIIYNLSDKFKILKSKVSWDKEIKLNEPYLSRTIQYKKTNNSQNFKP